MQGKLELHEAIAVVLLSKEDRIATYKEISDEIAQRGLYFKKNGDSAPPEQIRLRTHPNTSAGKSYSHLFDHIAPNRVRLKNL